MKNATTLTITLCSPVLAVALWSVAPSNGETSIFFSMKPNGIYKTYMNPHAVTEIKKGTNQNVINVASFKFLGAVATEWA